MNQIEEFFLNTLRDLEQCILEEDPYKILRASALIRKLFLDDYPLVDQINRKYRLKISFKVAAPLGPPPNLPPPSFFTIQDGIDPDTAPPFKRQMEINRDQFFKIVPLIVKDRQYTIRDIILFEANVMGGVHAGSAKEDKSRVLQKINDTLSIGGYRASLRQLKAIGRVVLKALTPLKEEIEKSRDV
jgi:hypothetical protein